MLAHLKVATIIILRRNVPIFSQACSCHHVKTQSEAFGKRLHLEIITRLSRGQKVAIITERFIPSKQCLFCMIAGALDIDFLILCNPLTF